MNIEPTSITLGMAALAGLAAGAAGTWFGPRLAARVRLGKPPKGAKASSASKADRALGPASVHPAEPGAGLMSRSRFDQELQERLLQAEKQGRDSCVLYIAVDGLRRALEGKPPEFSVATAAAAALRLRAACGASTPLSRVADEEYAVWLDAPREAAEKLAARLTEEFAAPLLVAGQALELSLSVGVAVSPEHGSGARLIKKAAAATRAVQRSGGAAHAVFDPRIGAEHNDELALAQELQEALRKQQLELFFQPKIDAREFGISAIEALLRWRHPTRGLVNPARMVEVAERQGLIEPLGQWVLDSLLKRGAAWRDAGLSMNLAVNLSGVQFRADNFAASLQRALKTHGVPANTLTCEISETVALEDAEATRRAFSRLRSVGVRIAVADFTGSAAGLAALPTLPVQEIKISRGLVAVLADDAQAQQVVQNIVTAAQALQMRVVAEGVESTAQRDQAVRLGCDQLQGYLFVRPMSARAVAMWAADATQNLAQTLRPSHFKDTLAVGRNEPVDFFAKTEVSSRG